MLKHQSTLHIPPPLKEYVMKTIKLALTASTLAFASVITNANADVIDFTNAAQWQSANGQQTFTSGYTTISASGLLAVGNTASNPAQTLLTFNAGACGAVSSLGLACNGRGIGIDRGQVPLLLGDVPGEIDRRETLTVNFVNPLTVTSLEFLNLVRDGVGLLGVNESMDFRFNGGTWQTVTMTSPSAPGGYFSTSFAPENNVTQIDIRGGGNANLSIQDGSLARIGYVPLPATAALLLLGGLGAVLVKRKKQRL
jgi:hypothetical protein